MSFISLVGVPGASKSHGKLSSRNHFFVAAPNVDSIKFVKGLFLCPTIDKDAQAVSTFFNKANFSK